MKPKRKAPWNWLTFLNRAVKKEPSLRESFYVRPLAAKWPTCACGQLCKKLNRLEDGTPPDFILRDKGIEFYDYICDANWTEALNTFHAIEARTAELLSNPESAAE